MIDAEVRSHCMDKLERVTAAIRERFQAVVDDWSDPSGAAKGRPTVEVTVRLDFPVMRLSRRTG